MFRPPPKKKRQKADDESIKKVLLRLPKDYMPYLERVLEASPGHSMNATLVYMLKMATALALGEIDGGQKAKAELLRALADKAERAAKSESAAAADPAPTPKAQSRRR